VDLGKIAAAGSPPMLALKTTPLDDLRGGQGPRKEGRQKKEGIRKSYREIRNNEEKARGQTSQKIQQFQSPSFRNEETLSEELGTSQWGVDKRREVTRNRN